jgi:protein-S-isoprenylcysteine O-methyltransferase Ste14
VRLAITLVALLFTCAMAFATMYVLLTEGPDIFTLFGVLIVALFALGIFGALAEPPDRRR